MTQIILKTLKRKFTIKVKYDLYLQSEPTEDWETAATFSELESGSITLIFNFALHSTGGEKKQFTFKKRFTKNFKKVILSG